jgi:hypothetical protein
LTDRNGVLNFSTNKNQISLKNHTNNKIEDKFRTGRLIMAEATKGSMVYVYDKEGNAYICDIDDLRDASQVSDEEKADCTDLDRGGFSRNE